MKSKSRKCAKRIVLHVKGLRNSRHNDNYFYLSGETILKIHEFVIKNDPDFTHPGILMQGMENAIAERPRTKLHGNGTAYVPYEGIFEKAASLIEAICCWHIFIDGNKRTAFISTAIFLDTNGYHVIRTPEWIRFTVMVAQKKLKLQEVAKWLKAHSSRYESIAKLKTYIFMIKLQLLFSLGSIFLREYTSKKIDELMAFDIYPESREEWLRRFKVSVEKRKP